MPQDKVENLHTFRWLGTEAMHLDTPGIDLCGDVVIGRYGGRTSAGAKKNEDGALVWSSGDGSWEFALVVDAHYSAQSAELLLSAVEAERNSLVSHLQRPVGEVFNRLQEHIVALLSSKQFRARCAAVHGEASCIFCAQKGSFLWWLSVGDCVVYLLHPELARQGQYALNQRSYFEWIGERNTFELAVPCYASGVRELGSGQNVIVITTDGLLECGKRPFEDARYLYKAFTAGSSLPAIVETALKKVHQERGADSATVIAWTHYNTEAEGGAY